MIIYIFSYYFLLIQIILNSKKEKNMIYNTIFNFIIFKYI